MEKINSQSASIELNDRRQMAYSEFGDPGGKPILFFHGWPGARLQGAILDRSATSLGLRVISPDRPGFGRSDYQPDRTILDWPEDLLVLADRLQLEDFSVLGLSGGAPYALACAVKIPHRLTAVGIISGIGPSDAPDAAQGVNPKLKQTIKMCMTAPWLVRFSLWRMARKRHRDPARAFAHLLNTLPEPDREALSQPTIKPLALAASTDTFRNGTKGHFHEICLFARPWGFQMGDIQAPVQLWHGEEDEEILPITAHRQSQSIPGCRANFLTGEGHYSLYINHHREILDGFR
jgi:pimeloyl-ACP methyl ester carboxylesterase